MAVSAREFYIDLGLQEAHYAKWSRKNIVHNSFAKENEDWTLFTPSVNIGSSSGSKGRPTQDYALSIDFAKRLAMMARTEKGETVRRYFIECEQAKKKSEISPNNNLEKMLLLQSEQIQSMAKMVETVLNVVADNLHKDSRFNSEKAQLGVIDGLIATTVIAAELGMTASELNLRLNALGIIYKVAGTWVLYAKYKDLELTGLREVKWTDAHGKQRTVLHTYWTQRGRTFIHQVLKNQAKFNS